MALDGGISPAPIDELEPTEQPKKKGQFARADDLDFDEELQAWNDKKRTAGRKKVAVKIVKAAFSHIGLSIIVILYSVAGGFIFEHLEVTNEETLCVKAKTKYIDVLNATVDLIWDDTNRNDLSDEDKKEQFRQKLNMFRESVQNGTFADDITVNCKEKEKSWSFIGSVLFAVTVITTIGYGHIAPKTHWGRLVCIAYAMLGIPILLMFLANIGDVLASVFRFIYSRVCCCGCCKRKDRTEVKEIDQLNQPHIAWQTDETGRPIGNGPTVIDDSSEEDSDEDEDEEEIVTVPLTITLLVMAGYILLGAVLFGVTEGWKIENAAYFSFVTVSTIGFGDIVPGIENLQDTGNKIKLIVTGVYMVVGMAFLSMCFSLMQEEVVGKFEWIGSKLGLIKKDDDEDGPGEILDEEDLDVVPQLPVRPGTHATQGANSRVPSVARHLEKSRQESRQSTRAQSGFGTAGANSNSPGSNMKLREANDSDEELT